jgi:uncharacterized protein involved in exopolysaccharide biosynthesis
MIEKEHIEVIDVGIFDLILAVVKRKRFVLTFTVITTILITIYCFVVPTKWVSLTQLAPIAESASNMQFNTDILNSLGAMPLMSSQKQDLAVEFVTILDSRTFREDIVRKFDLVSYFKIKNPNPSIAMEKALNKLSARVIKTSIETQNSNLKISVLTKDKVLSKNIAEYCITSLAYYERYQKKIKSKQSRQFLEQRTNEIRARIDTLMAQNKQFETQGNAFALDKQTEQALKLYSDMVSQKMLNDIEMELALQQYGNTNPKYDELKLKNQLLNAKITNYEKSKPDSLPQYMLRLHDLPESNLRYNKIQLDLKTMSQVYELLYPMTEQAKLTELKDTPSFDIIDSPNLAGTHARPDRLLLIVVFSLVALLFASLISILDAFMGIEQKSQLTDILRELGFKRFGKHA